MNRYISISARFLLMMLAMVAVFAAKANSSSLDERFKAAINTEIQKVMETQDPVLKRKMLGDFLIHMDQGIGTAKTGVSEQDQPALNALQAKIQADYAELNGNGVAKVPDSELNHFAGYVQQDVEQADYYSGGGVYISVGGIIIILLLILILFR